MRGCMRRGPTRRFVHVGVALAALLLLAACSVAAAPERWLYVDGSRGCKQPAAPVNLWEAPGAVPAGAEVVMTVPHGTLLLVEDTASRFGVEYHRVTHDRVSGWLPAPFTETIEPICE